MPKAKKTSIAAAIQQTRPFSSVEQELYLALLRTASELAHATDQFLKPYGVTQAQFNVLRILRGAGAAGQGRNEIATRMVSAVPDMSRLLDRMEKHGWIERERSQDDRRQVATRITSAGKALLTKLEEPSLAMHRTQFGGMQKSDLKHLIKLLSEVRASVPQ